MELQTTLTIHNQKLCSLKLTIREMKKHRFKNVFAKPKNVKWTCTKSIKTLIHPAPQKQKNKKQKKRKMDKRLEMTRLHRREITNDQELKK